MRGKSNINGLGVNKMQEIWKKIPSIYNDFGIPFTDFELRQTDGWTLLIEFS